MKHFIKICGITSREDALCVVSAGADAIGLNMYDKSPRFIGLDNAVKIYNQFENSIKIVLVFVDEKKRFVNKCFELMPNIIAQFHGSETEEYCSSFGKKYIKVLSIRDDINLEDIKRFSSAEMVLLDSFNPELLGGTGVSFDWSLLKERIEFPILLAGGLSPLNINSALKVASCEGVDVCSGVELQPGMKDPEKVKDFINKVRKFND